MTFAQDEDCNLQNLQNLQELTERFRVASFIRLHRMPSLRGGGHYVSVVSPFLSVATLAKCAKADRALAW